MPQHRTVQVHGAVILVGSDEGLNQVRQVLGSAYRCHHYRANALMVADVTDDELDGLVREASAHGVQVDQVCNTRGVLVAAENEVEQPKQPDLSILSGNWYRTNQEAFPLIHVVEARNQVDHDGVVLWLFDVDFVGTDALPQQATVDADQLKSYKPKPATLDDFEELDIAPPYYFEENPHTIPSVEDDIEEKTAGVSLPKAQVAAMALQREVGRRYVNAEVVPAVTGGFAVEAKVFGNPPRLPKRVEGVRVRYRR